VRPGMLVRLSARAARGGGAARARDSEVRHAPREFSGGFNAFSREFFLLPDGS